MATNRSLDSKRAPLRKPTWAGFSFAPADDLSATLREARDEIGKAVGRSEASSEFDNYTKGWLTSFADDIDQSGSVESLIDTIASKYVDEDGESWKDEG